LGATNEVPVVLGTNRDENKIFLTFGSPFVRRLAGVPIGFRDERLFELHAEYQSLMWKALGVDQPATAMRRVRDDVYGYRWDWDDERSVLWVDLRKLLGAAHGLEIPFVFGSLRLGGAERYVFDEERAADDRKLADAMTSYWTRFAATGDPGTGRDGELPRWEPWAPGRGSFVVLDSEHDAGIRMSDDTVTREAVIERIAGDPRFESDAERCEVYESFLTWSRSMSREEIDARCAP
jgi:para-nitrobenzyl esterase